MSNPKPAIGKIPNIKFNMDTQEVFVKNRGIILEHWAAIPSAIGMKDRGDYRRPDSIDTLSSNGMIYKKVGEFTGVIVGNSLSDNNGEGGLMDHSQARLILPKFYDVNCFCENSEIHLIPGDRIYPKQIELKVPNYQKAEYIPNGVDFLQYPVKAIEFLIDSKGIEYKEGVHFKINKDGNLKWMSGKKNPGIDPDTGKGRIYGVRYLYLAFWYVERIINEIRITNKDTSNEPTRMPYQAMIAREYVFHNKNRGDKINSDVTTEDKRTNQGPTESITPNKYPIKVNVNNFEE